MGVLTVTLDKCMNLRDKDGIGRSDPYVNQSTRTPRSYRDDRLDYFLAVPFRTKWFDVVTFLAIQFVSYSPFPLPSLLKDT